MKALGLFFRFICSLIVLLYVALYLKTGTPIVDLQTYQANDLNAWLTSTCTSLNWVTVTAGIILILTLLRIMNLVWNVAFNLAVLAFLLLFFCAAPGREALLLPAGLSANPYVQPLLQLPFDYPAVTVIVFLIFILGWIGSNAAIRIAITATVCFGLWYGLTALADCVISPWTQGPEPASAGVIMALAHPWLPAAILGTFFLIFSMLMSVFETFSFTRSKKKAEPSTDKTQTDSAENATATANSTDKPADTKPADKSTEEKAKPHVIKKPLIQPKPAAAKKAAESAPAAPKPAEDKPAEPAPAAPKPAEDKPAEPAPTAPKPAEDKPAEPAPAAPKPAEDKPAEPAPAAPKPAEDKPAEPAPAAPKPEGDKPAEA